MTGKKKKQHQTHHIPLFPSPKQLPSAAPHPPPSAQVPARDGRQPLSSPLAQQNQHGGTQAYLDRALQSAVPEAILHTNNYYNKPPSQKQRLKPLLLKANHNFCWSLFGVCFIWRFLTLEVPFFSRRPNCPPSCPELWRSPGAPTALLSVIAWTYLLRTVPPRTEACTLHKGI